MEMYADIEIDNVEHDGVNIEFDFRADYVISRVRFFIMDKTRKNATYKNWIVLNVYVHQIKNESGIDVNHVTNHCLFIERKKQWILEKIMREHLAGCLL